MDTGTRILDIIIFLVFVFGGYILIMWGLSSGNNQGGGKKNLRVK